MSQPCGTYAGACRHRYHKQPLCEPCKEADRANSRARRLARNGGVARPTGRPRTQPCGTVAGYARHRYNQEEPCEPCREAERSRMAARPKRTTKRERARKTPLQPCGTYGAWQRHWRRGEEPCEPCALARCQRWRDDHAAQREAS